MDGPSQKLEDCEVCGEARARYTCPKCEVRTCCLACVNIHKKELDCDGVRDKTKYVPLKSFTDLDVLSDYRLLEEVGKSVDQLRRDPFKKCTMQMNLPVHLYKLKAAAFRRKVYLHFMPQNFSRHKSNTTFLMWKTNELYWRIEWIFPQAENTKWVTQRALETKRLSTLVEEVLAPITALENTNDIEELNLRKSLSDRLQFYQAAGLSGVKVLLKAEKVKKSDSKFYELDVTLTLMENLERKTIIEYPTLYVILKDHSDMYEIMDSDDEDENKFLNNIERTRVSRKRPHEHFDRKEPNEPVNYFFNTDFSESDDEATTEDATKRQAASFNIPTYDELVKMEQ